MPMETDDTDDYRELFSDARRFICRFVDCDANILNTCVPFVAQLRQAAGAGAATIAVRQNRAGTGSVQGLLPRLTVARLWSE